MLTPEKFQYISGASNEDMIRLNIFVDQLKKWQSKVNLVSNDSLFDVWRRHILDSTQLIPFIDPNSKNIADIGSGAGFPGMVLAIFMRKTETNIHLIESNAKKCAFLREVSLATEANVIIHNIRAEELKGLSCDIIVARAVASVEKLLQFATPILDKRGICLFLKGKKWRDELTRAKINWIMKETVIKSTSNSTGRVLKLEEISSND